MIKKIRVGSRDSKLAVMQTEFVMQQIQRANPYLELELVTLKTTGDLILDKTLDKIGGKGLFVKELDQALYENRIDLAVHSLKDMTMEENTELPIVALPKRGDPRDVLVLPLSNHRLELSQWSNVGSSSTRRQLQLKRLYPECSMSNIRGNIITRLKKLDMGQYSALVLAASGLQRVNLQDRISAYFSVEQMIPAAGQGVLAVQARKDVDLSFLDAIQDKVTWYQATAEREYVRQLNGGCSSPIAAYAIVEGTELKLTALYYNEETKQCKVDSLVGMVTEAKKIGYLLAEKIKRE